jgi:hypothetical protein
VQLVPFSEQLGNSPGSSQKYGTRTRGFAYDANGNVTADPVGTYVFDGENRIAQSTNGVTVNYAYDGSCLSPKFWRTLISITCAR